MHFRKAENAKIAPQGRLVSPDLGFAAFPLECGSHLLAKAAAENRDSGVSYLLIKFSIFSITIFDRLSSMQLWYVLFYNRGIFLYNLIL